MSDKITFPYLVALELEKARNAHGPQRVPHESLGVIREEYVEFEQEVFARKHDPLRMLAELVQLAAMCQRAAEDLDLPIRALADSLAYASIAAAAVKTARDGDGSEASACKPDARA